MAGALRVRRGEGLGRFRLGIELGQLWEINWAEDLFYFVGCRNLLH